jgi:electron transfer flavoprotein alpha subunit
MKTLVLAEHDNKSLKDATNKARDRGARSWGDVHVLVAGQGGRQGRAEAAGKLAGVKPRCCSPTAPPTSTRSPSRGRADRRARALPTTPSSRRRPHRQERDAARRRLLDVMQISDIIKVVSARHLRAADLCRQRDRRP